MCSCGNLLLWLWYSAAVVGWVTRTGARTCQDITEGCTADLLIPDCCSTSDPVHCWELLPVASFQRPAQGWERPPWEKQRVAGDWPPMAKVGATNEPFYIDDLFKGMRRKEILLEIVSLPLCCSFLSIATGHNQRGWFHKINTHHEG